ncbi:MAG: phosphoribosylaminoimidazolesuccinocarboxamide synthase [Isosphaeraceae bacterium]
MGETALSRLPVRRGKVRDVYELGNGRLLFVASDRISAFDWVLPGGIPDKGRVLTGLSAFWFEKLRVPNHLISTDLDDAGLHLDAATRASLDGRSMVVKKADVIPFECVVRGYLSGSGWREYQAKGTVCGEALRPGLTESDRLAHPIFTPATKAEAGHDENVPLVRMVEALGAGTAETLMRRSLEVYLAGAEYAESRGLILADTKFEWGHDPNSGELLLIDEVLTPDSSRYWPRNRYRPGGPQPSHDKQYVRDWLETTGWDKASPPPSLPDEVVARTREKYVEAYETLIGRPFPWT